jgi:nucleoporin NDC1
VKGTMSTPDRLNERPIYLRSVFLLLAFCQIGIHIYKDYSSVHLPVSAPTKTPTPDNRTHKLPPTSIRIQHALPEVLQRCGITCAMIATLGPFIYALFLRQTFWSWHLRFAKLIYSLARSDARPTGYPPSSPKFMLHSFGAGFLLMLTWETTSLFFSILLSQEPVKKDQPLSTSSKDPNGTLITGLKAKRDVVKTFAFWELVIIAQKHPERRKAIFADIDREGGTTWSQMLNAALDVVQSINTRVEVATTKPNTTQAPRDSDAMEIDSLPRIAPPVTQGPIFADSPPPQTRTEEIESYIDWGAKRIGQSKHPFNPPVSKGKELLIYVTPASVQLEDISLRSMLQYGRSLLQSSPIGWFFRTNFERKVNTIILGSPQGNAAVMVDAMEATTRMLVASLSEDLYGKVIHGVPSTVRSFTSTINAIEAFVQNVKEEPVEDSNIEEVEIILARLKASLAELLSAFQLYLTDQGLSAAEHRQAQNASRPGRLLPEREQRRKEREAADKEKARRKELEEQPKDARKEDGGEKGRGNANRNEKQKGKENGGERRPQKKLEPQDPARKKLFQNTVPKSVGSRREMEMVR